MIFGRFRIALHRNSLEPGSKTRTPRPCIAAFASAAATRRRATCLDSWIEANFDRCFDLVEYDNPRLFQEWVAFWSGRIDFETVAVVPSAQTRETIGALL